jgi:hypothetical protein
MKKVLTILLLSALLFGCEQSSRANNTTALDEQEQTELNQRNLFAVQPPPKISWSLERDNLIKRFKLQNDRSVMFYMYIFNEGISEPIGYYQVNKVSSVNSQLTNTEQIISGLQRNNLPSQTAVTIPSPAEDGSYGTNGDAVFGFTPNDIYIEHNMHYIVSTVPLAFKEPRLLTVISLKTEQDLKVMMDKLK